MKPTRIHRTSELSGDTLLVALQEGVPVASRPFARIGRGVGLTEADVLERIRAWFACGLVRRFGAVFDAERLGYRSTLCAVEMPADELAAAAARLGGHPGITHCYERAGQPNLWFTLTAPAEELRSEVARAAHAVAPHALLNLPAVRKFKVEAIFGADARRNRPRGTQPGKRPLKRWEAGRLSAREQRIVRCLQGHLPLVRNPFAAVAKQVGCDPSDLLELVARWQACGVIRRIGVVVRHRRMGFTANSMCVWKTAPASVEAAGACLARSARVTHCFERRAAPAFPYNLYAMLHAGSRREARARFADLERRAALHGGRMLWSVREFKKTSPVFLGTPPG